MIPAAMNPEALDRVPLVPFSISVRAALSLFDLLNSCRQTGVGSGVGSLAHSWEKYSFPQGNVL